MSTALRSSRNTAPSIISKSQSIFSFVIIDPVSERPCWYLPAFDFLLCGECPYFGGPLLMPLRLSTIHFQWTCRSYTGMVECLRKGNVTCANSVIQGIMRWRRYAVTPRHFDLTHIRCREYRYVFLIMPVDCEGVDDMESFPVHVYLESCEFCSDEREVKWSVEGHHR